MLEVYPSPSPSPLLSKTHVPIDIDLRVTKCSSNAKKRKHSPSRSVAYQSDPTDKVLQRIIRLDVYSAFRENPRLLLTGIRLKPSTCTNTTTTKTTVPEFTNSDLNMDEYMDTNGAPNVSWKAGSQSLKIAPDSPDYNALTPEEITTCSTLRIYPSQYLNIKKTMLQAVCNYGPFKKREAQTWFRIDVNKALLINNRFA